MTSAARTITEFVPGSDSGERARPEAFERPVYRGHMLVMPLTNREKSLMDPVEITSCSRHRTEPNVTVIRLRHDKFTYFVDRDWDVVDSWMRDALGDD